MDQDHQELYRHLGFAAAKEPTAAVVATRGGPPSPERVEAAASRSAERQRLEMMPEALDALERALDEDPEGTLKRLRAVWDGKITEPEVRDAIAEARLALREPRGFMEVERTRSLHRARAEPLPAGFTFPGMDPAAIPIPTDDRKFDARDDKVGWALHGALPLVFRPKKAPFRPHTDFASRFAYTLADPAPGRPVEVALFADFGTGRFYSRYIAKQLCAGRFPAAFHLGDVYYMGQQAEFDEYFTKELQGLFGHTPLYMVNGNHEMYAGGVPYFRCIDEKRRLHPEVQRQEGSYACVRTGPFQLLAIDTDFQDRCRLRGVQQQWLAEKLAEGRRAGRINVLLSSNEPYEYGSTRFAKLYGDLRDFARQGLIDLWFWGNTHYCGLFDRGEATPFVGSCIGHAGHSYDRQRGGRPTPAPLRWLEDAGRFPEWTGLTQAKTKGNSGYCVMSLRHDGSVGLRYVDWMASVRCTAELARDAPGSPLALRAVTPMPQPAGP